MLQCILHIPETLIKQVIMSLFQHQIKVKKTDNKKNVVMKQVKKKRAKVNTKNDNDLNIKDER